MQKRRGVGRSPSINFCMGEHCSPDESVGTGVPDGPYLCRYIRWNEKGLSVGAGLPRPREAKRLPYNGLSVGANIVRPKTKKHSIWSAFYVIFA